MQSKILDTVIVASVFVWKICLVTAGVQTDLLIYRRTASTDWEWRLERTRNWPGTIVREIPRILFIRWGGKLKGKPWRICERGGQGGGLKLGIEAVRLGGSKTQGTSSWELSDLESVRALCWCVEAVSAGGDVKSLPSRWREGSSWVPRG